MSDFELVKEFTNCCGFDTPDKPNVMNKDEVYFLIKMMIDELLEFAATVSEPVEAKEMFSKILNESKDVAKSEGPKEKIIADQVDALVDSYYYSLNACAKKGVNFSKVFNLVHFANMAKRDPETGKFLRREDGKIIKPVGWKEPDIHGEIVKQMKNDEESFK